MPESREASAEVSPVTRRRRAEKGQAGGTPSCLYPDEKEVGRLILGERASYWRGLAVILEREGMPRVDPEFGGRYWPAVRAFLDERNALRSFDGPAGFGAEYGRGSRRRR